MYFPPQQNYNGNFTNQQGYDQQQSPYLYNPSHAKKMIKLCKKYRNQHVNLMLMDGASYNGFIEFVDQNNMYVAIPVYDDNQSSEKQEYRQGQQQEGNNYSVTGYQVQRFIIPVAAVAALNPNPY